MSLLKKLTLTAVLALLLALPGMAISAGSAGAGGGLDGPSASDVGFDPAESFFCNVSPRHGSEAPTFTYLECADDVLSCTTVQCIIDTLELRGCTTTACLNYFLDVVYGMQIHPNCGGGGNLHGEPCTMILISFDGDEAPIPAAIDS